MDQGYFGGIRAVDCGGSEQDGDGAALGVGGESFEDGEAEFAGPEDEDGFVGERHDVEGETGR